jgi:hypothetical protein
MTASSLRSGRRLFVIRHVIIIEIGPTAAARFAGFDDGSLSYLGSATLHPRLYSAARYRGLRYITRISCKSLGKDKVLTPG